MGIVCVYLALMLVHIIQFYIVSKGLVLIKVMKRSFMSVDSSHYFIVS